MRYLELFLIILTLIVIGGCSPQQAPRAFENNVDSSASSDTDPSKSVTDANFAKIQWFAQSKFSTTLTINEDNKQNSYFRGDDIYNYLIDSTNFSKSFCVVIDFPATSNTTPNQLRALVVPQKTVNFSTGQAIYFFRVNLNSDTGNSNCDLSFESVDPSSGNYVNTSYSGTIAHQPSEVCTNCQNIITSSKIEIYSREVSQLNSSNTVLVSIKDEDINTSTLGLARFLV